jgi:hypothetical protein
MMKTPSARPSSAASSALKTKSPAATELAPVDVRARATDDRDRRHDADQAPRRRQDLHRDCEREERKAERAAEAKRAAQREVKEKDRGAVGELEGRKGLEQAVPILREIRPLFRKKGPDPF